MMGKLMTRESGLPLNNTVRGYLIIVVRAIPGGGI